MNIAKMIRAGRNCLPLESDPGYNAIRIPPSPEMMTSRGIGLIGLGRHGLRYAHHLLHDVPQARLAAICRRRRGEGERFAAEHGVRFYEDFRELIADPAVAAIVVATPPSAYEDICLESIRQRKPMLVEKPLGPASASARAIVGAAQAAAVPLMTAQTLRFEPTVRLLKEQLAQVGELAYLVLTSRVEPRSLPARDPADFGGRGALLEIGIHLLDLVRFLLEDEVAQVRCELDSREQDAPEARAWASLRTAGGIPCLVEVSRLASGRVGRVECLGRDGQLAADWIHHRLRRLGAGTSEEEQVVEARATLVETVTQFLEALDQGGPMPVTGLDGLRAVEIADACYESAETGKIISLEHERPGEP